MKIINSFELKLKLHRFFAFFLAKESCLCCGFKSCFMLCDTCLKAFTKTPKDLSLYCSKCGSFLVSEKNICLNCRDTPLLEHIDFVLPLHAYRLWKKQILFHWKIHENRAFSSIIAKMYDEVLLEFFPSIPIIPIPPRAGKIRKKGWDQMEEIAKILAKNKKHTIIRPLIRLSQKQQKKLNRKERLEIIGKMYSLKKGVKNLPSEVILIDDILTTGATLESSALVLKEAGVKKVFALCLFIAY